MLSTYYVATEGNNSYDGLAPTYDGTHGPWQTVAKVNGRTFAAGDTVLFKRGEVWREQLTISSSGTAGAPITFGAYGTGANPQFNGADLVTGWTQYSGDIWKATVNTNITSIPQVFLDGARETLARSSGWSTIDAASTNGTYLYDTSLTQADDYWVGATAVIRYCNWQITAQMITDSSSSAHTITWNIPTDPVPTTDYGYYLENQLNLIDTAGEWYFDPASHTLYLQMASGQNPNSHTVEASVRDHGFLADDVTYVAATGLDVKNTTSAGISFVAASYSDILNNNVSYSFDGGIYVDSSFMQIAGNTVTQIDNGEGIGIHNGYLVDILNNTIADIASDATSPRYGTGIRLFPWSSHITISGNTISSISGHGIMFQYGPVLVSHNTISHCAMIVDDEGAIYMGGDETGTVVEYNRIFDCTGNLDGTPSTWHQAVGIYLDETGSSGATIQNNIISGCSYGIDLHKSYNTSVLNNTLYNNTYTAINLEETSENQMYGITVKNNICYAVGTSELALVILRNSASTNSIGTFDNNLYYNPNKTNPIKYRTSFYTLTQWRTKRTGLDRGNDAHSLAVNPGLVNVAGGNFHLTATSPCVNTGASVGLAYDYDGVAIPQNSMPDIGAFEYLAIAVESVVVNDGNAQRSKVASLTITFNQLVTLGDGTFEVLMKGSGAGLVALVASSSIINNKTVVTLTFSGSLTEYGSLKDGEYQLTIKGDKVASVATTAVFDGDGNGAAGGNYVFGASAADKFFRKFGDSDGDHDVDSLDLARFRQSYLTPSNYNWYFDFDGDGDVDTLDLARFRLRYLT